MSFADLKTRKPNMAAYHAQRRADKKRAASMRRLYANDDKPKGPKEWEQELKDVFREFRSPVNYRGRVYG